jgi:hypothetical protein
MKFETEQIDETGWVVLIKREPTTLAGSICRFGDNWHVEITLWSGSTGDIEYDAPSLAAAEAFVAGVWQAFEAMEQS